MEQQPQFQGRTDLAAMVKEVADEFTQRTGFPVGENARDMLTHRALPHQQHVDRELSQGKITMKFLKSTLRKVLETAHEIAVSKGRDRIGEDTTEESMKRDCPYLFWC